MYQGTTPTIPLTFKGVNLIDAKIYLSLLDERKRELVTFESGKDFEVTYNQRDTVGEITLTQEQTLEMSPGRHIAQARWIFPDGSSGASKKTGVQVNDVLLEGVISYE